MAAARKTARCSTTTSITTGRRKRTPWKWSGRCAKRRESPRWESQEAAMAEGVVWDHAALSLFFVAVSTELLPRIANEVEDVAHAFAPVRVRKTPIPARSKRLHAGGGGNLKASVQSSIDRDELGMYA